MNRLCAAIVFICLCSLQLAARQDAPVMIEIDRLSERLVALDPDEPMGYFELAEEVVSELRDERGRTLARTLYVLAYDLSRDTQGVPQLTRSVCLALAALEDSDLDHRRWLLALASLQDSDVARSTSEASYLQDARETIAVALSYYRAEDLLKARVQLGRPHAQRFIKNLTGEHRRFIEKVTEDVEQDASCSVCRNKRTIRNRNANAPNAPDELCTRCSGNPGLRLTEKQYIELLRFEIDLLGVPATSWSAQNDRDAGEPLREADPDQLAPLYEVNPRATRFEINENGRWRQGAWVVPMLHEEPSIPGP